MLVLLFDVRNKNKICPENTSFVNTQLCMTALVGLYFSQIRMFSTVQNHILVFGEGGVTNVHNVISFAVTSDDCNASMCTTTSPKIETVGDTSTSSDL